ncbi:Uncharacterised protein [Vibrio cholerae]|nr:Uncharacterised protein [Vibrio cholerae]
MNADFISVTIEQLPEGHLRAQQCPSKKAGFKISPSLQDIL